MSQNGSARRGTPYYARLIAERPPRSSRRNQHGGSFGVRRSKRMPMAARAGRLTSLRAWDTATKLENLLAHPHRTEVRLLERQATRGCRARRLGDLNDDYAETHLSRNVLRLSLEVPRAPFQVGSRSGKGLCHHRRCFRSHWCRFRPALRKILPKGCPSQLQHRTAATLSNRQALSHRFSDRKWSIVWSVATT